MLALVPTQLPRAVSPDDLPVLPAGDPVCPAGQRIDGATRESSGCLCRLMRQDRQRDKGYRMSPAALAAVRDAPGGQFLTLKSDPSTVLNQCFGTELPVVSAADGQRRRHYTYCWLWQVARQREWAGKTGLTDQEAPYEEPTSMGVEVGRDGHPVHAPADGTLDDLVPPKSNR